MRENYRKGGPMRIPVTFVLAFAIFATQLPSQVAAYTFAPCWWPSSSTQVTYKWGPNQQNPIYLWRQRFTQSVSDWSSSTVRPDLVENSSSPNVLDSYDAADGNYGTATLVCSGTSMISFTAKANSYYGPTYNWDTNFMRSIAGHELGHGLGLNHSTSTAIMNTSRDRYVIYVPQSDDTSGIAALYPPGCPC